MQRPRTRRARGAFITTAALWGMGVLCGCPSRTVPEPNAADDGEDTSEAEAEAYAKATQATFEAALTRAGAAFELGDPLAVARSSDGPLAVPRPSLDRLEAQRKAIAAARVEASGLSDDGLDPKQRVTLRTLRFGLDRMEDRLGSFMPERRDPHVGLDAIEQTLDELELRLALGKDVEADRIVGECGDALRIYGRELATGSPASLRAARVRLGALRARLDRLRAVPTASIEASTSEGTLEQLDAFDAALSELLGSMEGRDALGWHEPLLAGRKPGVRMPDLLGGPGLERRLRVEEFLMESPDALRSAIEANLRRLEAMRPEGENEPASARADLDAERCTASVERVRGWMETLTAQLGEGELDMALSAPDCSVLAATRAGDRLDDAELDLWILRRFVLQTSRRAVRGEQHAAIALVSGEMAPQAQLDSRSIAVTLQVAPKDVQRRAIEDARVRLCTAGVGLQLHQRAPETAEDEAIAADQDVQTWFARNCEGLDFDATKAAAIDHPRRAMLGLGFATFDDRPDVMAGLDHFYWAPLGLTYLLSHPDAITAAESMRDTSPAVQVKLEPIDGETASAP